MVALVKRMLCICHVELRLPRHHTFLVNTAESATALLQQTFRSSDDLKQGKQSWYRPKRESQADSSSPST